MDSINFSYFKAIPQVTFDNRIKKLILPWSDIRKALYSVDLFSDEIDSLMNNEQLFLLFDKQDMQPFLNYPKRIRAFKHKIYENICLKCQTYYIKYVLDEVMTVEYYTLEEPNYSQMEQITRFIDIGEDTLAFFRKELEESIKNPVVDNGILFLMLSMIDREVKERVLRLHYNKV